MPPRTWTAPGVPGAGPTKMTDAEMSAARLPHQYRDHCSHLLTLLNACRAEGGPRPWACHHEKHSYIECQYVEFHRRQRVAKALIESDSVPAEWRERWDKDHVPERVAAAAAAGGQ